MKLVLVLLARSVLTIWWVLKWSPFLLVLVSDFQLEFEKEEPLVLQSVHWMAALLELEKDEALVLQSAWGMAALLAWMWVRMWDAVSEE